MNIKEILKTKPIIAFRLSTIIIIIQNNLQSVGGAGDVTYRKLPSTRDSENIFIRRGMTTSEQLIIVDIPFVNLISQ